MLTGYIMHFVNPQFALGTYHTLEGLVMMAFGLALLHCECCILDLFFRMAAGESEASAGAAHLTRGRTQSARLEPRGM
jgi:hypothetical protein